MYAGSWSYDPNPIDGGSAPRQTYSDLFTTDFRRGMKTGKGQKRDYHTFIKSHRHLLNLITQLVTGFAVWSAKNCRRRTFDRPTARFPKNQFFKVPSGKFHFFPMH